MRGSPCSVPRSGRRSLCDHSHTSPVNPLRLRFCCAPDHPSSNTGTPSKNLDRQRACRSVSGAPIDHPRPTTSPSQRMGSQAVIVAGQRPEPSRPGKQLTASADRYRRALDEPDFGPNQAEVAVSAQNRRSGVSDVLVADVREVSDGVAVAVHCDAVLRTRPVRRLDPVTAGRYPNPVAGSVRGSCDEPLASNHPFAAQDAHRHRPWLHGGGASTQSIETFNDAASPFGIGNRRGRRGKHLRRAAKCDRRRLSRDGMGTRATHCTRRERQRPGDPHPPCPHGSHDAQTSRQSQRLPDMLLTTCSLAVTVEPTDVMRAEPALPRDWIAACPS